MTPDSAEQNDSKIPVEFVVPHVEAMGLRFITVVRAKVRDDSMKEDVNFLRRLRRAITSWIKETEDGKAAWKLSSEDFNLGDLANEYHAESSIIPYLAAEGIDELSIESLGGGCRNWIHDTVLVNEHELESEEE